METTFNHPCHVNIEKALKDLDDYSASQLDHDVFTYIAEWVNSKGKTWPGSPCMKSIANAVEKSSATVSKSVHRLEEWGLLEISQGYLDEDEHPRNMYAIPSRYLLDETSAEPVGAAQSIETQAEPASLTPDIILRRIAGCLADYSKARDDYDAECREAQACVAAKYQKAKNELSAYILQGIVDFLNDALKRM